MSKEKDFICGQAIEFVLSREIEELGTLTVARIARELNVSPSYLSRLFKCMRHVTLKEYLVRTKMFISASLLLDDSHIKIAELAQKMGFEDAEYFACVFKKNFGVSPAKFRECKKKCKQTKSPRTWKK